MKIAVVGLFLLAGVVSYLGCSSPSNEPSNDGRSRNSGSMTAHPVTEPTLPDSPQTAAVEQEIAGDAQTEKGQEADVESDDNKAEESVPLVRRYPTYLTRYDIATPEDMRYAFLISPLLSGDEPTGWTLFDDAFAAFGEQIGPALSAQAIATEITTSMPIDGNKPFQPLSELVEDCARILGIESPEVFVRRNPVPQAYVRDLGDEHMLVVSSGLMELFSGAEEELRFVIGHELGHIKCDHNRMKLISSGLLALLATINEKSLGASKILPTLALGRFLSWSREAEISADRAGLLCCQDPQVAYNALARLLHGVRPDNSIWNEDGTDFDPETIVSNFEKWENRPFVNFVVQLKKYSSTHPFIPDRIAALRDWVYSGISEQILARSAPVPNISQEAQLEAILVEGLASEGTTVDPYLRILSQDGTLLAKTPIRTEVREAAWKGFQKKYDQSDGQPMFFEIWDSNYLSDTLIGLFVIYPNRETNLYRTGILWDVDQRTATARTGLASVKLRFLETSP